MSATSRKEFLATATLIGTIVGAGIFSLPYIYSQAFINAIVILIFTILLTLIEYILYIDLISEEGMGFHQLPGIVGKIFGRKAKNISGIFLLLGRVGIIFLYTLLIGNFSALLIKNTLGISVSPTLIAISITILFSLVIRRKIKAVAKVQSILSFFKVALIAVVSIGGIIYVISKDPSLFGKIKLFTTEQTGNWLDTFKSIGLLYGVNLGALSGIAAIPSLKEITNERKSLTKSVIYATVISALLYVVFCIFVIAQSPTLTMDSLTGLGSHWWVNLLILTGLICVITAYLGMGNSLFEIYSKDYSLNENLAWILTIAPGLALYLSGYRNFVQMMAILGGVIGGIEGIMILASYWKKKLLLPTIIPLKKVLIVLVGLILGIGALISG